MPQPGIECDGVHWCFLLVCRPCCRSHRRCSGAARRASIAVYKHIRRKGAILQPQSVGGGTARRTSRAWHRKAGGLGCSHQAIAAGFPYRSPGHSGVGPRQRPGSASLPCRRPTEIGGFCPAPKRLMPGVCGTAWRPSPSVRPAEVPTSQAREPRPRRWSQHWTPSAPAYCRSER